jgi:phosphatidate cytidylyltransferase
MTGMQAHWPQGDEAAPAGKRRWVTKTIVGLAAGAVAVAALLSGPQLLFVLVLLLSLVSTGELFRLARTRGLRPAPLVGFAGVVALFTIAYVRRVDSPKLFPAVVAAVLGLTFVTFLAARRREGAAAGAAATLFAVVYAGLPAAYIVVLRRSPNGFRATLVFGLMAVLHDVGAFFAGTAVGRHALAPRISPGKTWEGLVGGTATTFGVAAIAATWLSPPFSWTSALVLAAIVSVVTPFGDLAESMIKRDVAAKDSGQLLPGQGGALDIIDELLFAAPVFFYAFRALTT